MGGGCTALIREFSDSNPAYTLLITQKANPNTAPVHPEHPVLMGKYDADQQPMTEQPEHYPDLASALDAAEGL